MQSGQASVGINAEVMVMLVKRCADLAATPEPSTSNKRNAHTQPRCWGATPSREHVRGMTLIGFTIL